MTLVFKDIQKLQDGRRFAKLSERTLVQLNNVILGTPFAEGSDVTLTLSDPSSVRDFDARVLECARENSTSWFEREVPQKTLETALQRSVVDSNMNVSKSRVVKAFDVDRSEIDPNSLEADTQCDVVLEAVGVSFMKKTFGTSWRVVQVRKKKEPRKKYYETYLFTDPEEEPEPESEDDEYL